MDIEGCPVHDDTKAPRGISAQETLLPCPFCGGVMEEVTDEDGHYFVHPGRRGMQRADCWLSDAWVSDEPSGEGSIGEWNTRASVSAAKTPSKFYGAECPSYPNCTGGCGLGCTHDVEAARASHLPAAPAAKIQSWPEEDAERTARAIVRARELFEKAPYLQTSENRIGGCGLVTYGDLKTLQEYAEWAFKIHQPTEERRCQKCGTPTGGEEAFVDGQIWCHPCADAMPLK